MDLVELRVDCLRREPDLKRILKERPTPMVFTIRRGRRRRTLARQGGQRQQLLREAIAAGVDYVDLEMDIAAKIRRFGKTKRIISYHNMKTTPGRRRGHRRAVCGIRSRRDQDRHRGNDTGGGFADFASGDQRKAPTIPIAMGEIGVFTRILGAKFGAPFTYAGFNPERVFAAGMMPVRHHEERIWLRSINANTEVYGVIGDPIEQSLSPRRS